MSYLPLAYEAHNNTDGDRVGDVSAAEKINDTRRQLRIALLGYRSHPHVGGQGIYLHYLSKALVELGHSVDVISGPPYPELDARVKLIKIPSLDLYAHPNPVRALRLKHLLSFTDVYEWWSKFSGAFGEPYCFGRRVQHYFRQHQPSYDVVHDNQSLCYGLLDLQKRGVNVIATVHHPITRDRDLALAAATGKSQRWLINRWYSFLSMQKKVVQDLQNVVTVSVQSQYDIEQAFARPAQNIHIIPNGVDTAVFKPIAGIARHEFSLVTTASSDQPLKGLSILLRALAQLRIEFPALQLIVIGKLNKEGDTQKELENLQLLNAVQFKSGISNQQLVEEYARATIAVVPSLYEGFGLPAAEAMACGVPLVCSDGGALPEVVGEGARLVKAGDTESLVAALRELMAQPDLRGQLGERGRAHIVRQLSWDCVGKKMQEFYFHTIHARAGNNSHAHN